MALRQMPFGQLRVSQKIGTGTDRMFNFGQAVLNPDRAGALYTGFPARMIRVFIPV